MIFLMYTNYKGFVFMDFLIKNLIYNIFITCSGYGIAAQALTAVIRAYDGRDSQTMLTSRILKALGLSSPDEIIGYVYHKFYP